MSKTFTNVWFVSASNTWQRGSAVAFNQAREWAQAQRKSGLYVITHETKALDVIGMPEGPPRGT
jgi:hypothetical protein